RRRGDENRFSKAGSVRWLSWLAGKMLKFDQSIFLLENLQPDWTDTESELRATISRPWVLLFSLMGFMEGVIGFSMVILFNGPFTSVSSLLGPALLLIIPIVVLGGMGWLAGYGQFRQVKRYPFQPGQEEIAIQPLLNRWLRRQILKPLPLKRGWYHIKF